MAQLVDWLAYSGARKSDGTVVATGSVYCYRPGTTSTQVTVYSDKDGTTALTQPVTTDAAGRAVIYTTTPCRIEVQDSAGSVVRVEDRANTVDGGNVEVQVTGINGTNVSTGVTEDGGRTDLESALSSILSDIDDIGTGEISPTDADYGAAGDGTTDDTTAFQAAITAAVAAGKRLRVPEGTYLISSALTCNTKGLTIYGTSVDDCIIKQSSTSANGLTIDIGAGTDTKMLIKDLTFTCSTSSSGAAVSVTSGDRVRFEGVHTLLFRTGIDTNAVSGSIVSDCVIESNDGNAAVIGINLGARGRATNCEVISATDVGSGIKLTGTDARATNCYLSNFTTAINVAGARGVVRGCHSTGATTGILLAAANCAAENNYVVSATTGISATSAGAKLHNNVVATATTGISLTAANAMVSHCTLDTATTGISVGAVASVSVFNCSASGGTTDLTVNSAATLFLESGNSFTGTVTNSALSSSGVAMRNNVTVTTSASATPTFTPDISGGKNVQVFVSTYAAGAPSLTIANHATATLAIGDIMWLVLVKSGANDMTVGSWGTQYDTIYSANPVLGGGGTITTALSTVLMFYWDGTTWRNLWYLQNTAPA